MKVVYFVLWLEGRYNAVAYNNDLAANLNLSFSFDAKIEATDTYRHLGKNFRGDIFSDIWQTSDAKASKY